MNGLCISPEGRLGDLNPRRQQSAGRTLEERAPGYGVARVFVEGNDMFAVHTVMIEAVSRARGEAGPTLV